MISKAIKLDKSANLFILKWLVYWLSAMGLYSLILRNHFGYSYESDPIMTTTYFLVWGGLGAYFFSFSAIKSKLFENTKQLLLIGLSLVSFIFLPPLIDHYFALSPQMIKNLHTWKFMFPLFEFATCFSKLGDILFQQALILALVLFLEKQFETKKEAISVFTMIFFVLHIPLFLIFKFSVALIFIIPSLTAGAIFSYCILSYRYGVLASLLVHMGFYVGVGVLFRFPFVS